MAESLDAVMATRAESGRTLGEICSGAPVLLIFLRHFGCTFARQAIDDVGQAAPRLQALGVTPVFVHLGTPEIAKNYFDYYKLTDVERISDPDAKMYREPAFGLKRGNLWKIFEPAVLRRWLLGGLRKYGAGKLQNSPFLMPGIFLIRNGEIARRYVHRKITDRPDYTAFSA
jgi:hypothetical protein